MTIKDLARLSGYSVGTVSRALNGLPNVSEQARSAILALAQERGYQLNTNAKYLKQNHSSGIVAVVTGTSNELFAQMIERIQQTLPTDRYPLTVDYVDENEDPVEHFSQVRSRQMDFGSWMYFWELCRWTIIIHGS